MKKQIEEAFKKAKAIKLKIDNKTIITVRTKHAFDMWLSKFPQAQILL